jgi:hypothetical protein
MHELDNEAARLLLERLMAHRPRVRPKNLTLAVFMIVHGVEGILHALVVDHPARFETAEVVDELTSFVANYLAYC